MSLQNSILGLLSYQPMSGYDLKQVFDKSINFFWSAQLSQIYRDLGNLENKGMVVSHIEPQVGRPDRKVYTITREGQEAFQQWLQRFPSTLVTTMRDEFSLRVFFGSRLSPGELEFQFRKFIREQQQEIESYRGIAQLIEEFARELSRPDEKFYWYLTLKRGFILAEASIRWAEECLQELDNKAST